MALYEIEFGALGDSRPVPPLTVRTTDPNVLSRTVVDHARPHIAPVLEAMGRPELADCLFRTSSDRTYGDFLYLDLAGGNGARFLPARITVTPERVQRKHGSGTGNVMARYVGRGTRWANPSRVHYERDTRGWHVTRGEGAGIGTWQTAEGAREFAVVAYRHHIKTHPELAEAARSELAGNDLSCWCPLPEDGQPDHCHAAVLLEIANAA